MLLDKSGNEERFYSQFNKCIGDDTKGADRRSQNYIRKTKNTFCVRRYLSYTEILWKNCFPVQNFTEIGLSAAELWPKNDF